MTIQISPDGGAPDTEAMTIAEAAKLAGRVAANIGAVVRGKDHVVRGLVAAYVSGGHVLLEDVPGTGKTTLAKAFALSVRAEFTRIQFTPDLLPSDILGVSIYEREAANGHGSFRLHKGPVFTQFLLADEINRASPRTQSALLEAMAEGQVSIDGARHALDPGFFVIATQNPVAFHGTYPLPESQLDRFALRLALGYASEDEEVGILADQIVVHPLDSLGPVVDHAQGLALRAAARRVAVSRELLRYMVTLCRATREAPQVTLGASVRAPLALMRAAQAAALLDGSAFVTPDHVKEMAVAVIAHRLVLTSEASFVGETGESVAAALLARLPVPA